MRAIPYGEILPRALMHVLEYCFVEGQARVDLAACALDPGHGIVIMPKGEAFAVERGGCRELWAGAAGGGKMAAFPPIPDVLASRNLRALLGRNRECGLAYAFCTNADEPADAAQVAIGLVCGDEADGQWPPFRSAFAVSRGELDPTRPGDFVGRIMGEAWEAEEKLCRREILPLPEHEMTPVMAELVAKGDMVGLLRHICTDVGYADMDTAIVGSAGLHRICGACPGLASEEGAPCILPDGGCSVLAHDHVSGHIAVRPSLFGPELVYGPTVIRRDGSEFSVTRHCGVVGESVGRPDGVSRGSRIVLDPALGGAP